MPLPLLGRVARHRVTCLLCPVSSAWWLFAAHCQGQGGDLHRAGTWGGAGTSGQPAPPGPTVPDLLTCPVRWGHQCPQTRGRLLQGLSRSAQSSACRQPPPHPYTPRRRHPPETGPGPCPPFRDGQEVQQQGDCAQGPWPARGGRASPPGGPRQRAQRGAPLGCPAGGCGASQLFANLSSSQNEVKGTFAGGRGRS